MIAPTSKQSRDRPERCGLRESRLWRVTNFERPWSTWLSQRPGQMKSPQSSSSRVWSIRIILVRHLDREPAGRGVRLARASTGERAQESGEDQADLPWLDLGSFQARVVLCGNCQESLWYSVVPVRASRFDLTSGRVQLCESDYRVENPTEDTDATARRTQDSQYLDSLVTHQLPRITLSLLVESSPLN